MTLLQFVFTLKDDKTALKPCTVQHPWGGRRVRLVPAFTSILANPSERTWPSKFTRGGGNSEFHVYNDYPGTGTYTVGYSSQLGPDYAEWAVDDSNSSRWVSSTGRYNSTTGAYTGSQSLGGVSGEWFGVFFPLAVYIESVSVAQEIGAKDMVFLGRNTTNQWVQAGAGKGLPEFSQQQFTLTTPGVYNAMAIVVRNTYSGAGAARLFEVGFHGAPVVPDQSSQVPCALILRDVSSMSFWGFGRATKSLHVCSAGEASARLPAIDSLTGSDAQQGLRFKTYSGYFAGTDTTPRLNWFDTAEALSTGLTTDLSSLAAASGGLFGDVDYRSLKLSGYFRAKKRGVYRFVTSSDDASFLTINGALVVKSGGTHATQLKFGEVYMAGNTYYKLDIFYGESTGGQELQVGFLEPQDDGTTSGSTNLGDFTLNATGLGVFWTALPQATNALACDDMTGGFTLDARGAEALIVDLVGNELTAELTGIISNSAVPGAGSSVKHAIVAFNVEEA